MGRAEDLYARLEEGGEAAIDQLIADRQSEELFLDFKRSADNGAGPRLHQGDRANIAKAISGFGNSEGGVIVWGVDCRNHPVGGDVAQAKVPIHNPQRFKSWLEGAVSGCTVPPHPRVRHAAIERSGPHAGTGFVLSLIAKSHVAPHQCVGPLQYFIRAGSDFVPTPHGVLAQLFGRRPAAFVFHAFTVSHAERRQVGGTTQVTFSVGFSLCSRGPGLARGLYTTMHMTPPLGGSTMSFTPDTSDWSGHLALGVRASLVAKDHFRLAPEGISTPLVLHVQLAPPFEKALQWSWWYGHERSPVRMLTGKVSASRVQELYEDFIATGAGSGKVAEQVLALPVAAEPGPEGYEDWY